jgi:hypothetical protein
VLDLNYDPNELCKLYGKLGLILDGHWFLEIEKQFGFETAYKIDEAVWLKYTQKETKRLKEFLKIEKPTIELIKQLMSMTLFAQNLKFDFETFKDKPKLLRIVVTDCKSYKGMETVKRPKEQITKICEGIGMAYFKIMIDELVPGTKTTCVSCPYKPAQYRDHVCIWDFEFPRKIEEK